MKSITLFAAVALLSACTAQQLSTAQTTAGAVCATYHAALQADPALEKHNPQYVADGNAACALAPLVITAIPPTAPTTTTP